MSNLVDQYYMQRCLELAAQAEAREEVPVGALCVFEGRVVGVGSNSREADKTRLGMLRLMRCRWPAARSAVGGLRALLCMSPSSLVLCARGRLF